MKRLSFSIFAVALGFVGCNDVNSKAEADRHAAVQRSRAARSGAVATETTETTKSEVVSETTRDNHAPIAAADNTKINVRDRDDATMTPGDQGESKDDVSITQQIRKEVMGEDLSFTAKNVKIITVAGNVTLRGPVRSDAEKAKIAALAKHVAGVKNVDNQIEVATK